jgi:hypothetical protein
VTRAASAARLDRMPAGEEPLAGSGQESNASVGVAGAMGLASLRRQLATLQMSLADAQSQLANEQQGRAEDADALAALLERVTISERAVTEAANLRVELEREREFVEELRVSVREKYEDCNALRQSVADTETLLEKERGESAERAALLERQLAEAQTRLAGARASEEATRTELAALSTQLVDACQAKESLDAELQKANAALKGANTKVFAANKQLESWKVESQRKIDQDRAEHEAAVETFQREALRGNATALALRKQLEGVADKWEAVAASLEALDRREREIESLRELAQVARGEVLEQIRHGRRTIAPAGDVPATGVAAPASFGPAALAPAAPSAVVIRSRPAAPPRPAPPTKPVVEPAASPASSPEMERGWDAPSLEIGESEMRVEDLVEELLEAQNRDHTRDR